MSTISYSGSTFFNCASNGFGWDFEPGIKQYDRQIIALPLGDGELFKSNGKRGTYHVLLLVFKGDNSSIQNTLNGLAERAPGTLVVPSYGSYQNCIITAIDNLKRIGCIGPANTDLFATKIQFYQRAS